MSKKKKIKVPKVRNWGAVAVHFKTGAGSHGDNKKKKDKNACRGKVTW
tara:strand:- start:2133 stop:2276 length:144 start_codon:yes stop_codon:yes gene_type:complete